MYRQAWRKRMCARQMEPQVKSAERPDRACSQVKTTPPEVERET